MFLDSNLNITTYVPFLSYITHNIGYHKSLFFLLFAGYEWVGWRNDTLGMAGKPVEMVFEFDSVRNFSAMILHTNNMFSKDVQVSSR